MKRLSGSFSYEAEYFLVLDYHDKEENILLHKNIVIKIYLKHCQSKKNLKKLLGFVIRLIFTIKKYCCNFIATLQYFMRECFYSILIIYSKRDKFCISIAKAWKN